MRQRSFQDFQETLESRRGRPTNGHVPSFVVDFCEGPAVSIGGEDPAFEIVSTSKEGNEALLSLDLLRWAEMYLCGQVDVRGDFDTAMASRSILSDFRPLLWAKHYTPRLVGIGARDAQSIAAHYDRDPRLFGQFLDPDYLCYTHGLFDSGTVSLLAAIVRMLDWAHGALRIAPGGRVLDVGGGWGAFLVYGAERGLDITSLTLSGESEQYMRSRLKETGLSGRVVLKHFFDFTSQDRFHGIVNMGATEHLPNYRRSFSKYRELLLPGGILYVDCLAAARKFRLSSFLTKHVYPGGQSPMVLPAYLRAAAREGFTVLDVRNDRGDYAETCRRWVSRLREREEEIVDQWGVESFRFFNAWLGASAVSFDSGLLQAYRLVLRAP